MGWNTSALFVRGRSIDEVVGSLPGDAGFVPSGERLSADHAWRHTPGQRLYLAEAGGWCQMWDTDQRISLDVGDLLESGALTTLKGTRALAVLFAGVSGVYGWWLYDDGALVRGVVFQDGEPVVDVGEPLAVESRAGIPPWGPDEDFLWTVINDVTGLTATVDQLFDVYAVAER
ncbi:hypothetical protein E1292_14830 [Nonomuraea deserti]|uniref:Uncharacterized protein n=1 Tax=Nonomuraea deserti TaxID=1848322 RepID=A0A4R4VLD2_9ACTN|nr:hypothetical protein [Nonomuraea deserti]TDD06588.1 hypothetical protein E1292_14830 [Nonomuraea deserti]